MTGRQGATVLSEQAVDILASRNLRVGGSQAVTQLAPADERARRSKRTP
jgi:hypothetical protein